MATPPSGTVTFLFTDIEGSTQRWEHQRQAMQQALPRHDALLRHAIESHGGYVFKTVGDAFCAAFSTAIAAVDAAVAAQRALAAEVWPPECEIRVRMALHSGAAEERAGDYYGLPLNRVARLLSVGHGGQTLLSLATQQLVRDLLPADITLRDLGEQWLKDLIRPERVYQLVLPDLPATFPPLKALDQPVVQGAEVGESDSLLANPYKGLRAFQEADAPDFFGREALAARLAARLHEGGQLDRFLAVVGPSGSGKSSVVRAGLLPALREGTLPGAHGVRIIDVVPGAHPLEELEAALLRVAVNPPATLLEQLQADDRGLVRAVKRVLPAGDDSELVLLVDQFEEVFTLVADEAVRLHFLSSLCTAVKDPRSRVRIVITLRADFYDRPLLYPDPGELVRQRTEVVLPLSPDELYRAITGPAMRMGVQVEPELVSAIQRDVAEQPGTLPLLQYALTELFEQREGRQLTLAAYQARGGVLGALSRRAEELYAGLTEAEREVARQVFLRLVTLGEGVEDTRRRTQLAELESLTEDRQILDGLLELFGQHRLLTFDRDPSTNEATVEVAHEALLRSWERLRIWLGASRDALRIQRRLMTAAMEWANAGQDPSFLASGARLAQFRTLQTEPDLTLTQREQAYLEASITEHEAHEAREAARQAHLALLLARSERLRLAAEANNAVERGETGDLPALLAIQSLRSGYTPQADGALLRALERGIPVQTFAGIWSNAAFSPDGTQILASDEGTFALWDIESGRHVRQFSGQIEGIYSVAFSPDWEQVVTGSADGTLRLLDVATGRELRSIEGHTDFLFDVDFAPDGRTLLTSSGDGTARLWDVASGREVRELQGAGNHVAFSPDGRYAATASETARVWDVQTGQVVLDLTGHGDVVIGVAFSPDGRQLLTGSLDQTARVWDVATGREERVFTGHTGAIYEVAFASDGATVLTASADKTARLWDARTGNLQRVFVGAADRVTGAAFSPDGQHIITRALDDSVRVWDVAVEPEPRSFGQHDDRVTGLALSPDEKHLVTASWDQTARVWDVETGRELMTLSDAEVLNGVVFTPDGKRVVTAGNGGTARLWDAQTGQELAQFVDVAKGFVNAVALSADGQSLVTGGDDEKAQKAYLWNVGTGQQLRSFVGHAGQITSMAFSPDGNYVLTGGADKTARLWDTHSGREVRQLTGHGHWVQGVAFSPDGTLLLTTSHDKTARLWNVESGQVVRTLTGHTGPVTGAVFSPDGRSILTGSYDKTARLWDTATGELRRVFTGHADAVSSVAFSADGQSIFTGSWDGTARKWRTDYQSVIQIACAHLRRDLTDAERTLYEIRSSEPTCPDS